MRQTGSWILRSIIIILLIVSGLLQSAGATEGAGSAGASYLSLPLGPKSIAMGEAKAALIGDPFNWTSNPAALHYMNGSGIGLLHAEWILDTRYDNISSHHRFSRLFALGAAFTYEYYPDIQGYDELGIATEPLKSDNYQALAGLGFTPHSDLTIGLNIKYFRERLHDWTASGMGVDIGILYYLPNTNVTFGAAAQHLGPDIQFNSLKEPIPTTIRIGASHELLIVKDIISMSYAVDAVKPRFEDMYLSAGSEIILYNAAQIRIGYCGLKQRAGTGFTMGGGISVKDRLQVDYAWTPYGDLGNFHRLSLYFSLH